MNDYAVVYLSSVKHGEPMCEIHKAGCRDLSKKERHQNIRAVSTKSVISEELKGEMSELGYTASDYKVMPCAHA